GNMWVTDLGNNRVLEFTPPLSTGESASLVLGQTSFTTSTAGDTSNTFNQPTASTFDSSGNLWVSDISNNRVLEFTTPFSMNELASVVIGQSSFTTNSAGTSASIISSPRQIAFDSS